MDVTNKKNDENNVLKAWKRYRSQNGGFFYVWKKSAKMHYNKKKDENAAQKEVQYCPKFPWGETEKIEPEKILLRGLLFSKISGGD